MSATRHAGIVLPLFSAASRASWGIGDFADLPPLGEWLAHAGFDRLMVLPLGLMADGQTSPYSAISAMALDPVFISVEHVPDFDRAGGLAALSPEDREALARVRAEARVHYAEVRRLKAAALARAFASFVEHEWTATTPRAAAFAAYIARQRWWLDDVALFRAIGRDQGGRPWDEWPAPLASRSAAALDAARRRLGREVLREQYLQWLAESQWQEARGRLRERGVVVLGDLPFMVERNSADVWTRAGDFLPDATVGAPPDAYSATGQDWGLPAYGWDRVAPAGFLWLRDRARRMAALYDGFRVDHVVGFYRTYVRPVRGAPYFSPSDPHAQIAQGEAILAIFRASGATLLVEDLGTVPDEVRASLARLEAPGYRVLRWERDWHAPGQPFLDPAAYPARSVAATGTHDTEPVAVWWDALPAADRRALAARLPGALPARGVESAFDDQVRDAILEAVYASGSDEILVPAPDLFGWRARLNTPGTVSDDNWTWRLPWPVDSFSTRAECVERAVFCRALAERTGRA